MIAGVETERSALVPVLRSKSPPLLCLSGAKPETVPGHVEALIAAGADAILSFGVAGGLDPQRKPGDLIVADRVIGPDGRVFETDQAWRHTLARAVGSAPVPLAGSDRVEGVAGKRALYQRTGAVAVDMESHLAASVAISAGRPFGVLRAIADAADEEIPEWVSGAIKENGHVSAFRMLIGIAKHPRDISKLAALGGGNKMAMSRLSRAVVGLNARFGPTLGFLAR